MNRSELRALVPHPVLRARRRAIRLVRRAGAPVGSVTSLRTTQDVAVLTYDDGPEPGVTEDLLAVLAEHGVHATFFVLLTRVRRYSTLLDEVLAGGHDVALHGLDHRALTTIPAREVQRVLADARRELEDRTQRAIPWFRPPYGRQTPATQLAIRRAGLTTVLWNASAADSYAATTDWRLDAVRAAANAGTILLCHDGFADARDNVDDGPRPVFDRADLARRVIDTYRDAGLRPGSLSEALPGARMVREAIFRR